MQNANIGDDGRLAQHVAGPSNAHVKASKLRSLAKSSKVHNGARFLRVRFVRRGHCRQCMLIVAVASATWAVRALAHSVSADRGGGRVLRLQSRVFTRPSSFRVGATDPEAAVQLLRTR